MVDHGDGADGDVRSDAQGAGPPAVSGESHQTVTMGRLARRNLRAKPSRFVATMLAIVVGTGFLSGALVLRESLGSSLESNAKKEVLNVDAAVFPRQITFGGSGGQGDQDGSGVPVALKGKIAGAPGVAAVAGLASGPVEILNGAGRPARAGSTGRLWISVPQLNPFSLASGQAPNGSGEIAVDQETADQLGLNIGTDVSLRTTSGARSARVVGITRFGDAIAANSNGDIFVSEADSSAYLEGGIAQYDAIYIASQPTAKATVVGSVQQSVGANFEVLDNAQLQERAAGASAALANFIGIGLQVFAYVALGVCLFIVYNTFSIIVAQRVREFALLRAIGADTKQIRKSVRREALIIGVVASATGLLLGVVLFLLLLRVVPGFKSLASGGAVQLKLSIATVLQVMIFGVVITFFSAVIPSFRAGRTRPIAALQTVAIDRSGVSRIRAAIGLGLLALGAGLLVVGSVMGQMLIAVPGPFCLFLGVMFGGPRLAVIFTGAVGLVVRPFSRRVGKLAVENVRRNPTRTATTANALVIGVFLVVFTTAAGGQVRDWASSQLGQFSGPDITVTVQQGELPAGLPDQIKTMPDVTGVAPMYPVVASASVDGQQQAVAAADFSKLDILGYRSALGNLKGLNENQVLMWNLIAQPQNLQLGSPVVLTFANGNKVNATVGAIVEPVFTLPPVVMSHTAALKQTPTLQPQAVGVQVAPGQSQAVQQRINDLVSAYTNVDVFAGDAIGQFVKNIFNALIQSVNALLGVAVVIALFGIVNTLILSVTERTREIGVLRAVGMTRGQLQSTIRIEAVIVALLGTLVGMIFGMFVAYMVTRPIFEDGKSAFSWPLQELATIALLGLILGVVASLIPAWRASRLNALDAIRTE